MHQLSDDMLMARFRETFDEEALDHLVERHHAKTCRVATALLGNAAAAEDAVQEAFIRVVRRRRRFQLGRRFSPWFYTILRNLCRDHHRWQSRYEDKLGRLAEESTATVHPPTRGVHELLQLLSAPDREILSMRFIQGASFNEIARQLGCSTEAAKKRGQRALRRLREVEAAARRREDDHVAGVARPAAGPRPALGTG